ncbi:MAG: hypothetical protein EA001_04615 [Oscillatoriales cyanobacterium]|nr:MAG: hypothetical protein EA001_04615 [Oscillatoriales cyanobacterium]
MSSHYRSIATVIATLLLGSAIAPAVAQSTLLGDPNANNPSGDVRQNEVVSGSGVSAQDLIRNVMLAPSQSMDDFNRQQSDRIDSAADQFFRLRQQRLEPGNSGSSGATNNRPDGNTRPN